MKKSIRIRLILPFLALFAFLAAPASAAPYGEKGRQINWVQPTGEKLTLRVFGDEYFARTETSDGFTVVYNKADGSYHYAKLSGDRRALIPTGVQAHLKPRAGLGKGVALPVERAREIAKANRLRLSGERDAKWSERVKGVSAARAAKVPGARPAPPYAKDEPTIGDYVGLTILVQFPNDPRTSAQDPVRFPTTRNKIVNYCNQIGYRSDGNSGSIRDYFRDQSLGKFNYTQKVTPIITLPNPRNYYNYSDYPANTNFRDDAGRVLLLDAIEVLRSQNFDFSGLTTDDAGNILATNIFFAGPDSGVWAEGLWPHQWTLQNPVQVGTGAAPASVYAYQITNIEDSAPVIGTFIHENGHLILNYPDLYTYTGEGEGVGQHCLMGSGNYQNDGKTPAPLNIFLKDIVGWATVNEIAASDYLTRSVPSTGNIGYRIRRFDQSPEYFIVENRGSGDKWATYAQDKGVLIWHIDETIESGNAFPDPHYGVALEQSDGRNDLEDGTNRGDTSDAYDLSSPLFSTTTSPSSRWIDGSVSGVRVNVKSSAQPNMQVQFGEVPPNTIIVYTPSGGEIAYRQSNFLITWEANIIGNIKIDLLKDGVRVTTLAANVPNNGRFLWRIPKNFQTGPGFSVRLSSLSNPVPATATSDGSFTISDQTFPVGGKIPYGWRKVSDAYTGWSVTSSRKYEGTHSLKSNFTPDGRKAGIQFTANFKPGNLSFYMRTSSEVTCDYARFYIDGVEQNLNSDGGRRGMSGETVWTFFSFPVSGGNHTFKWIYEKDDSLNSGDDGAWLDAVALPPTTQEIAVYGSSGGEFTSGSSLIAMPDTRIGEESSQRTVTITNRGKADLYGIGVSLVGDHASAFKVSAPGKSVLKSGQSTTFKVSFRPNSMGEKAARIHVMSNDDDEKPFVINLSGMALGIPKFSVSHPENEALKDDKSVVRFGYETVGKGSRTKVFTIRNTGSVNVTGLTVEKQGPASKDFDLRKPIPTSLKPGESVTFKVTFQPTAKDLREATILVGSSYGKVGKFRFGVEGVGVPKSVTGKSSVIAGAADDSSARPPLGVVRGAVTIDGKTYSTITIDKSRVPADRKVIVEVSSNLVDWRSGKRHTTVLTDNESILKVRDNTPREAGVKRHIRVRLVRR
jgi:M6 family metalloprotease-like protein